MRAATVEGQDALGLSVDKERNETPSRVARVISPEGARTTAAVIPSNEELEIARKAAALVGTRTD